MTPFPAVPGRTATIPLGPEEEALIRRGFGSDLSPFDLLLLKGILEKLAKSLRASDVLLGPVGGSEPRARLRVASAPRLSLEELGL